VRLIAYDVDTVH